MKILKINNNFKPVGGVESVFHNTINLLVEKGHSVIPFCVDDSSIDTQYKKYFADKDNLLHNSFFSFEAAKKLERLIEIEKPDIAHIHTFIGGVTLSILPTLKRNKIPTVISIHGFKLLCPAHVFINGSGKICEDCKGGKYYKCILNNCSTKGRFRSILLSFDSYLRDFLFPYEKYIDQFVFVSRFTLNKYIEYNPNILQRSHHIYNFGKIDSACEQIPLDKYFLFVGRLDYEKGIFTLLDAFKNNLDQKLVMAGTGPLREEILRKKSSNVELVGFKDANELNELIKKAYFIIIPSECYENNPMAIVEAFSKGKPVIGTQLGGISELIDNYGNGFLFETSNYRQLSDILSTTSKLSIDQYSMMSKKAFNFAKENFSPEKHYNLLTEVYGKALNK